MKALLQESIGVCGWYMCIVQNLLANKPYHNVERTSPLCVVFSLIRNMSRPGKGNTHNSSLNRTAQCTSSPGTIYKHPFSESTSKDNLQSQHMFNRSFQYIILILCTSTE